VLSNYGRTTPFQSLGAPAVPPSCGIGSYTSTPSHLPPACLASLPTSPRAACNMSLSGSLLFCTDCGNILERAAPSVPEIPCEICGVENTSKSSPPLHKQPASHPMYPLLKRNFHRLVNQWPLTLRTTSRPDAFPSVLRNKRDKVQRLDTANIETWAKTSETCPSCKKSDTLFREMQLRGADEGSTVFFRCSHCSHMYFYSAFTFDAESLTRFRWKLDN
jgi:DNA-directed RNA polymerase I subunit RPA12